MRVLVTIDPATIGDGEADVNPNPLVWCHDFGGGRVFYSGLGHTSESYSEPYMVDADQRRPRLRRRQVVTPDMKTPAGSHLRAFLSRARQASNF